MLFIFVLDNEFFFRFILVIMTGRLLCVCTL